MNIYVRDKHLVFLHRDASSSISFNSYHMECSFYFVFYSYHWKYGLIEMKCGVKSFYSVKVILPSGSICRAQLVSRSGLPCE